MARTAEVIERWLEVVTSTLLTAMVLVILAQVLFRYVFNLSLAWTEEVGRYLFVWVCLLGASLAYRMGQHSGYETVVQALPRQAARWVMNGVDVAVAVFAVVLMIAARDLIEMGMGQLTPATQFRIGYVYLAFPLSGLLMLLFVADSLRQRRREARAG